jgi:membrane protease YdiL (CAAX protease family)
LESRNSDTFALGFAAIACGFIWLLVWVAFLLTHGPGPENRKELFLNLTWMDYSKFMVVPVFLFGWCLIALHRRQRQEAGWLGNVGLGVTLVGLVLLEVALVADRWTIPWGTYIDRESQTVWAGPAMSSPPSLL